MDELEARIRLLVADRNYLAGVVSRERRPFTDDEIARLATLNGAIDSGFNALRAFRSEAQSKSEPPSNSGVSDEYRLLAAKYYEANREDYHFAARMFCDYGKWVVVTIAGSHIGGIFFIGNLKLPIEVIEPSLWALVIGLILIILCGLSGYLNFMALADLYAGRSPVGMLVDPQQFPKDDPSINIRLRRTFLAAIWLGSLSAACLLLAAALLSWRT